MVTEYAEKVTDSRFKQVSFFRNSYKDVCINYKSFKLQIIYCASIHIGKRSAIF